MKTNHNNRRSIRPVRFNLLTLLIGILASALIAGVVGQLIFGPVMFGNSVKPSGAIATAEPALPQDFQLKKVIFSWTQKFNLQSQNNPNLGSVEESFFTWGRTFKQYDQAGTLVAVAHQRPIAWGTTVDIFDGSESNKLATLQEVVFSSLFKAFTKYRVLGPAGNVIGESEKVDIFATTIVLKDTSGQVVMTLDRPFINWPSDTWSIKIISNELDDRIAPAIAAFKSAADAERHSKSDSSSSDSSDSSSKSSGSKSSSSKSGSSKK